MKFPIFSALALLTILFSSCDKNSITGSGELVTETRTVSSFTKVKVGDDFDVIITQSPTQNVEVTADDNIINIISTEVENDELVIGFSENFVSLRKETIEIKIDMPSIARFELKDDCTGQLNNFSGLETLEVIVKDASELTMSGDAKHLDATVKDDSDIKGFDFMVETCNINLADASTMRIHCTDAIEGTVKDASTLRYKGNPTVSVSTSDAGKVVDAN